MLCSFSIEAELLYFFDIQKGKIQQSLKGFTVYAGLTLHILYSLPFIFGLKCSKGKS